MEYDIKRLRNSQGRANASTTNWSEEGKYEGVSQLTQGAAQERSGWRTKVKC